MSYGMTPYEFVQQVYYQQEKVVLDFWPSDDKYKEVLFEANMVLQELQNKEDWSWLRQRLILGPTRPLPHAGQIPEYKLPDWVYKPSTLHNDSVRLYLSHGWPYPHCMGHCQSCGRCIDEWDFIEAPYTSTGNVAHHAEQPYNREGIVLSPNVDLKAVALGNIITFNRPLVGTEAQRTAVCDVQRRIRPLHICNEYCKGADPEKDIDYERDENGEWKNPCAKIEKRVFMEIPDPNYVVFATAARHGEGSPPAQSRISGLSDTAMQILSAMRQNDSSATDADFMEWDELGHIEVV